MWTQEARPPSAGVREGGTESRRAVPAPSGLRPREAPPTRRPSLGPPGHLEPQGTEKPAAQRRHSLPRSAGVCGPRALDRKQLANPEWRGESSLPLPPGQRSCGAGWEGRVGRESGF